MEMGIAIAALILAILSLLCLIPLAVVFVAKHYFSEHIIQRVPLDETVGGLSGMTTARAEGHGRPDFVPPFDPFKEIGDPLTEDEQKYFAEMELAKAKVKPA